MQALSNRSAVVLLPCSLAEEFSAKIGVPVKPNSCVLVKIGNSLVRCSNCSFIEDEYYAFVLQMPNLTLQRGRLCSVSV